MYVYPIMSNRQALPSEVIVYSITTSLTVLTDLILVPWYIKRLNMSPIKQRPIVLTLLHRMMVVCMLILGLSRIIPDKTTCGVTVTAWLFVCIFGAVSDYLKIFYVYISYFTCKDLVTIYDKFGDDDTLTDDSKSATSSGNTGFMASASLFARIKKKISGRGMTYLAVGVEGTLLLIITIILAAHPEFSRQTVSETNCALGEYHIPTVTVLLCAALVVPFHLFMRGKMKEVQDNFGLGEEFHDLLKPTTMISILALTTLIPGVYEYALEHFIYFELILQFASFIASANIVGTPIKVAIESYQEKFKVYNEQSVKALDDATAIVPSKGDMSGLYTKFAEFLDNPSASKTFEDYMIRELNVENLLFYRAVQVYKQKSEFSSGNLPQLKKFAERIYKNFIDPASPSQVNLPSSIVDELTKTLFGKDGKGNDVENDIVRIKTVYLPAEYEIIRLMFLDSFARFSKTREYEAVEKEYPQFSKLL